jgi:hypothetical protein
MYDRTYRKNPPAATETHRPAVLIRRPAMPARDRELPELGREMHVLRAQPLFELFRELDRGTPLLPTLGGYADLLPLAGFIERMGWRDR